MSLKLVTAEDKQPDAREPLPEPPGPRRSPVRLILIGVIAVLVLLGSAALAMALYVGKQAEGFELTMQFGARTTHVVGTNVTLTEGEHETKCVLSLVDFRALREATRFLHDATPLEKPRGAPTFTLSVVADEGSAVNSGALPKEQLEPVDKFVISRASACIKTFVPKGPTPVQ